MSGRPEPGWSRRHSVPRCCTPSPRLAGFEFGLIAIVVGYGVGSAVRWGSNGRGGKRYQALAISLTFLAIVATYIPPIVQGFREGTAETAAVEPAVAEDGAPSAVPAAAAAPSETADTIQSEPTGTLPTVIAVVLILAIACAAPFLAGFENVIGIVIIGIGLYEAWKLNRRPSVTVTGPTQSPTPRWDRAAHEPAGGGRRVHGLFGVRHRDGPGTSCLPRCRRLVHGPGSRVSRMPGRGCRRRCAGRARRVARRNGAAAPGFATVRGHR